MSVFPSFLRDVTAVAILSLSSVTFVLAQEGGGAGGGGQAPGGGQAGGGQAPGGGAPGGGQQPGAPGGIPGGVPGERPGSRPGSEFPGPGRQQQSPFPEMPRAIYLSGKVVMDDGTPPPEPVLIERICNGVNRPEGYTDSKGRFSFQLGQNNAMLADASTSGGADPMGRGGMGMPGRGGMQGISERDLLGCELRAVLPGFRSELVNLTGRRAMDNPDVGTIILHRLAKVEGFTFSGTSAFAPKDARKAHEKGMNQAKKKKLPEAEKELAKAVELYPKYAVAWADLGRVYQMQNRIDDARRAYGESIKADSKYVTPYAHLAHLATAQQKWDEAAQYTSQVLKLNPYFSPDMYFFSAIANYNLQKFDVAEEHAREAAKMDEKHRNPKINHLLGVILAQKQDYKGAAENIRIYLKYSPDASDAAMAKQQLAEVEKRAQP